MPTAKQQQSKQLKCIVISVSPIIMCTILKQRNLALKPCSERKNNGGQEIKQD